MAIFATDFYPLWEKNILLKFVNLAISQFASNSPEKRSRLLPYIQVFWEKSRGEPGEVMEKI